MVKLLYPPAPVANHDTVAALVVLLQEARAGRLTGIAYVALKTGGDYCGDVVGTTTEHPLLTRGILRTLEDHIAKLIQSPW